MTDAAPAKAKGREVGFAVDEEVRDRRRSPFSERTDEKELSHRRAAFFSLFFNYFGSLHILLPSRTPLRRFGPFRSSRVQRTTSCSRMWGQDTCALPYARRLSLSGSLFLRDTAAQQRNTVTIFTNFNTNKKNTYGV